MLAVGGEVILALPTAVHFINGCAYKYIGRRENEFTAHG
jgi:hypothetical protein